MTYPSATSARRGRRTGPAPWRVLLALAARTGVSIYRAEQERQDRAALRRREHLEGEGDGQRRLGAASGEGPDAQDLAEAREPGRGRQAQAPQHIPWSGWKDILWRTYEQISADRVLALAAGAAFYQLLAIFPAVTAFTSAYGLFADITTIENHLALLGGVMPEGALQIIRDQVQRIAAQGGTGLSFGFIAGLAVALWSANAGMKAIIDTLNIAYEEEERRGFIKLTLVSLALTAGAILTALVAIAVVVVLPVVMSFIGLESQTRILIEVARWPLLLLVALIGIGVLYRLGPDRRAPQWRWVTVGSAFATVAWVIASAAFSFYISNFADYNATYGALGGVIGAMIWLWVSSIVLLMGAELNAEIEHQTAHDSTAGGDRPMGRRDATVADTVGEAKGR